MGPAVRRTVSRTRIQECVGGARTGCEYRKDVDRQARPGSVSVTVLIGRGVTSVGDPVGGVVRFGITQDAQA
jgi:hypothetical protein